MKKALCFLFALLPVFLLFVYSAAAQTPVEDKYNVSGKIISTDLGQEKPKITLQYENDDQFLGPSEKELTLVIEEGTKILDGSGKVLKKENLKIGDQISVVYKTKWAFYRRRAWPLSKVAESITVQASPEPAKKNYRY